MESTSDSDEIPRVPGSAVRWPARLWSRQSIPLVVVSLIGRDSAMARRRRGRRPWLRWVGCACSSPRTSYPCPARTRRLATCLRSAHSTAGAGLHEVPGGQCRQQHGNHQQRHDDQANLIVADRRAELRKDEHALQGSRIRARADRRFALRLGLGLSTGARTQRWCWGQLNVVRPPTVRRSSGAPSFGHVEPRCLAGWSFPVCEPPSLTKSSSTDARCL